jgi:hypothetical protein
MYEGHSVYSDNGPITICLSFLNDETLYERKTIIELLIDVHVDHTKVIVFPYMYIVKT